MAASYLLGSVTFGPILARVRGVDLRSVGSGNVGATNVLRAMGKTDAVITLLGDALKGSLAVYLGNRFLDDPTSIGLCGLAAVLGHNFPVFQGFKGGKGVATTLGALAVYFPWAAVVFSVVWIGVFAALRISSLSALIGFAGAAGAAVWLDPDRATAVLIMAGLGIVMHRGNIARLRAGTEPRFGSKGRP